MVRKGQDITESVDWYLSKKIVHTKKKQESTVSSLSMIIKTWSAHSTAGARITNMKLPTLLGLVFVFASWSLVQANTDVFDLNNQTIEYAAKSQTPDPEMLEEIFPEEYMKAHSQVKNFDEFQTEELRHEVSGGGRRDGGVHTWMGVFFLFTLLFWLYTQSAYVYTP